MIQPDDKSSKELLTRRIFLAVVSSVTLQFFFVCCLVLFANLSTDYVHWLQETWSIVTSLRMWTFLVIFTTVVFLQAVFCRRVYLHTPPYYKSRFTKLLATFTAQNLYLGTLYVIIGGILIWFHLLLKGGSTYLFFEVYLTEWTQFKFGLSGALSTDGSELTLIEALSMDKIPIMQHLGYLDLVTLAQKEKARRATLFTLSQPGGHPYNWNCVVQRCTDLLNKFSSDLNAISVKPQPPLTCYGKSVLTTMGRPTQQKDRVYHMRKLVPDVAPTLTAVETITQETSYTGLLAQFVKQKRDAFVTYLLSKPLINYIFGEQDENKIRYVLFNSQPVMWAAEAISSLSVFSLTEDHHGIVQKDIPTIVNALLSVKQALDKQQKSVILARRLQTEDKLIREIFTSLRSAIKRSLYRIVTNFEPYINDLCLESAAVEQLQSFLNYKE
ncbi:Nucleoporin NDC1 [Ooceraea biroi]|uniref:Nucleoporin NDC1 n=1 Tax=Ooceraea biroi TaxID=2015173 RepID=A0A026VXZ7_OOCBI|nr:Nucleoporin NDC1 [Ooceraea biroi]